MGIPGWKYTETQEMASMIIALSIFTVMVSSTQALQCYECSTADMSMMEEDVKLALEGLTSPRTMDGVAQTPQCQDVNAVPDEYLVDCEGVCLTGIFDMDQDILWRTCVTATQDCADLQSDPAEGTTYYCSPDDKGNNITRMIRGVDRPEQSSAMAVTPPADPVRNPEAPLPGNSEYDTEGWSCTDGWAIEGHNLQVLQMVTLDECKQKCVETEGCINIELGEHKRPVRGDVSWRLLGDWTQDQAEDQFIENAKYVTNCDKTQ